MFRYILALFFLGFYFSPLFAKTPHLERVYLTRSDSKSLVDKVTAAAVPLIAVSSSIPADKGSNHRPLKLIYSPQLEGQDCGGGAPFHGEVQGVLPANTSLRAMKAFKVMSNPGWFKKLLMKVISKIPGLYLGRGYPQTHLLVETPDKKLFVMSELLFYHLTMGYKQNLYLSPKGNKDRTGSKVMSHFQAMSRLKKRKVQRVRLEIELSEEYFEKCGYAQVSGKKSQVLKSEDEGPRVLERIEKLIKKHDSLYTLQNMKPVSHHQVEIDVDYKGLIFLMLNSYFLQIKEVVVLP